MTSFRNQIFVHSIQEFFQVMDSGSEKFNSFFQSNKDLLWWRGESNMEWYLQPSLYIKVINGKLYTDFWREVLVEEEKTYEEFRVRSYHQFNHQPKSKFQWLSIMQHEGSPTRLLDWSEYAITAMYFALEDYILERNPGGSSSIPCVWILKPLILKAYSKKIYQKFRRSPIGVIGAIRNDYDDTITTLLQLDDQRYRREMYNHVPMPILAPYLTERIKSQTGVFTIFPLHKTCSNYLQIRGEDFNLASLPDAEDFLLQINLLSPIQMSKQLRQMGVKRSMFYPELPNLAFEIEQRYRKDSKKGKISS